MAGGHGNRVGVAGAELHTTTGLGHRRILREPAAAGERTKPAQSPPYALLEHAAHEGRLSRAGDSGHHREGAERKFVVLLTAVVLSYGSVGNGSALVFVTITAIALLTGFIYPYFYMELVDVRLSGVVVLGVRNMLVLGLAILLIFGNKVAGAGEKRLT